MAEITLSAAMRTNLVNLQQTNVLLSQTQTRLASGKKVNSSLDNPTNFFAAAAHIQRADDLTARKDGMTESIQAIKASDTGITGIKSLIASANGIIATAATTSASGLSALYTAFNTIADQIHQLVLDSGYKGTNFLNGTSVSLDVLFNETGSNKLTIAGFDGLISGLLATANTGVTGTVGAYTNLGANITNISAFAEGTTGLAGFSNAAVLSAITAGLNAAVSALSVQSSRLASNLSIVNARLDFTTSTVNVEKTGADNLTLADTNEEGANLLSLQTRLQLSTTALSLASQANQAVLRLFP